MIAIIDYGVGNLRSISKAIELVGGKSLITTDYRVVAKSKGLILPGVGAFKPAIYTLKKNKLIPVINEFVQSNKPILGICLGMQLFFTESEEGGKTEGLNLIKGRVKKLSTGVKLPQIGWNNIKFKIKNVKLKIIENIPDNSYFYFVHSYYCKPEEKDIILSTTEYGINFPSIIQKNNIYGTQFHPEKSSEQGLTLLKNFCKMSC